MGLIIGYIVALAVLLVLSFFFSSSDMAYGSVDTAKLTAESQNNPKASTLRAKKLTDNYSRTISTILLLNDTVNAGLDSVSTLLGVTLCVYLVNGDAARAELWGLVASLICLVIKIIFGEILAKSFGKIFSYRLSKLYSSIIQFLSYLTLPITYLVSSFGNIVSMPLVKNVTDIELNEDDLHEMVEGIEKQGMIDEEKATILHETIRYTHTEAYEVMTPRVDVHAIDIDDDIKTIIEDPDTFRYSRIPVYEETIDNIIGYVKSRNIINRIIAGEEIDLRQLLEEPLRFPRSIEINEIRKKFKEEKIHFALIMDEYGGLDGIITMEDILEEIVGEIWDEKDEAEKPYTERKDGSYIIKGDYNLEDFCDLLDIDYEKIDSVYNTVGGFVVELLDDQFAKVGDTCQYNGITFQVLNVDKDNDTIDTLVVIPPKDEEEQKED